MQTKRKKALVAMSTVGVLAVGGVGTATALKYHQGWPANAKHVAGPAPVSLQGASPLAKSSPTSVKSGSVSAAGASPSTTAFTIPPLGATASSVTTAPAPSVPATTTAPAAPPAPAPTTAPAVAAPPATTAPAPASAAPPVPTTQPSITYTVVHGDNLSKIAWWFHMMGYGAIYDANKGVIGNDPNLIFAGERITIANGTISMQAG